MQITEIFYSIQGEGVNIGLPTIFIRMAGCNLNCSWCDTKYAKEGGRETKLKNLMDYLQRNFSGCSRVCITGGEPLVQKKALVKLIETLVARKYKIVLETNGSFNLESVTNWHSGKKLVLAVDVKTPSSGEQKSFKKGNLKFLGKNDMLKFVIADEKDYEFARSFLEEHEPGCAIIFTAVGGLELKWLAEKVLNDKIDVRVLPQLHKIVWGDDRRGV